MEGIIKLDFPNFLVARIIKLDFPSFSFMPWAVQIPHPSQAAPLTPHIPKNPELCGGGHRLKVTGTISVLKCFQSRVPVKTFPFQIAQQNLAVWKKPF